MQKSNLLHRYSSIGIKQSLLISWSRQLLPWTIPLLILLVWSLAVGNWIGEEILPSPTMVLHAAYEQWQAGNLLNDIGVSLRRVIVGFTLGAASGLLLGILVGLSQLSHELLDRSLQMLRTIPHLALVPLVILWFGIGEESKLFLTALGVLFPVYLNTFHGVRNVDRDLLEMGRIYGMSSLTLFRKVILPGALPSIFVGLRYALGIMWLTLIVSESIAASSGIGHMANEAREFMMTDVVVLSLLIYAALGKLADMIARALERYSLSWNPVYQK